MKFFSKKIYEFFNFNIPDYEGDSVISFDNLIDSKGKLEVNVFKEGIK